MPRFGRPGLLGTVARTAVVAGTATAVSGGMRRAAANKQQMKQEATAAEQQAQIQAALNAQQAQQPPAGPDRIAQLKELGELKAAGVLSDDEFAAEKARILQS